MRVHTILPNSLANGPSTRRTASGRPCGRLVVWCQGCSLNCPGCFSPHTHDPSEGRDLTSEEILSHVTEEEGITISGGEPLQQAEAVADLLEAAQARGLSTMFYSGYDRLELEAICAGRRFSNPLKEWYWNSKDLFLKDRCHLQRIMKATDLAVLGRYRSDLKVPPLVDEPLRSSWNQRCCFLTNRYSQEDLEDIPAVEVVINITDGKTVATGHK